MFKKIINISFLLFLSVFFFIKPLLAHHKVYGARVHKGDREISWRGHVDYDNRSNKNKAHIHVAEYEYAWTDNWQSEIEFFMRDKYENNFRWYKTEFQNQLEVIERDTWAAALYFSYNWAREKGDASEIEYKVLLEKDLFGARNIINFVFENEFGSKAKGSTSFKISYLTMYKKPVYKGIKIGFGGISNFGQLDNFNSPGRQKHQIGPGFKKSFHLTNGMEYNIFIGPLIGLTNASADNTLMWNMELEF